MLKTSVYIMNVDIKFLKWILLVALTNCCWVQCEEVSDITTDGPVFTNTWVVELHNGHDERTAQEIADENQFTFIGPVGSLPNHYIFECKGINKRSRRSADDRHKNLLSHKKVLHAEQQKLLSRRKRGFSDPLFKDQWYLKNTGESD